MLSSALAVAAPALCGACDETAPRGAVFCPKCAAEAASLPTHGRLSDGTLLVASGLYEGPLRAAVCRFKFEGRTDLAAPLAASLGRALRPASLPPGTVFVPVPLHPLRLAERGYNQAALVALELGRIFRRGTLPLALERIRKTAEQATLPKGDRLKNARGAFSARTHLSGSRVVLVDDVVTTGATALAASHAVRSAGGEVLAVAALARAA